jgi:hypothetical protein
MCAHSDQIRVIVEIEPDVFLTVSPADIEIE